MRGEKEVQSLAQFSSSQIKREHSHKSCNRLAESDGADHKVGEHFLPLQLRGCPGEPPLWKENWEVPWIIYPARV